MIEAIKKIINFLLFSNLYVALPIVAISYASYIVFNIPPDHSVLLFIYSGTLFIYNLHRLVGLRQIPEKELKERHSWALQNEKLIYVLIIASGTLCSYLLFVLGITFIQWLAIPAMIALGYSAPIFKRKGKLFRLRDIPFAKVFIIALTVSYVTIALPLYQWPLDQIQLPVIAYFFCRSFFIFSITIPFDIRDLDFDRESNINTIPMIVGVDKSKHIALFGLAAFAAISFILFQENIFLSVAHLLSAIVAGWIITYCKKDSSEYYYSLLIEGTMIFLGFFVWGLV